MRHLDLFSGIGGFALAATWVWGDDYENVGHSEIEKYPCQVYHRHFPESECLGDITKIDWSRFAGTIDLITGGFPCQPHSVAGKRQGFEDERDLWFECVRAIREIRPRFALFENVPGLFTSNSGRFFNRVLSDISESGYDCEWQVLSAAEVGAWHKRERVWIVAFPSSDGFYTSELRELQQNNDETPTRTKYAAQVSGHRALADVPDASRRQIDERERREVVEATSGRQGVNAAFGFGCQDVSDSTGARLERQEPARWSREYYRLPSQCAWWAVEPNVGRLAHGVSNRVDRLKGLGNAIVPQCAAVIMQAIKDAVR